MSAGHGRQAAWPESAAEWVSVAISALLLAGVSAMILAFWSGAPATGARFRVERGEAWQDAGRFYVPVAVVNDGDKAAASVVVEGALGEERPSTTIEFLAPDERVRLVLSFGADPAAATVAVASYQDP
jgi:uncharacterized protein (TIGR02588 family)